jgi:hypothetical protein
LDHGSHGQQHQPNNLTHQFCLKGLGSTFEDFGAERLSNGRAVSRLRAFSMSAVHSIQKGFTMTKSPIHKFRLGLITATIWNNDGFYSVDLSRSYKNSEGQWQSTTSYGHSDLLNIAKSAERAENWIARQANAVK